MTASTNFTGFSSTREPSLGVPGTSWQKIEVNTPAEIGATITTTARDPISTDRQRRPGGVTDLDSAFGFDADLTLSHIEEYSEGFWHADYTEVGTQLVSVYSVTAVVGATAATAVLTPGGNFIQNNTVTIASGEAEQQVYTFRDVPSAAYEVDVGGDAQTSLANLAAAINDGPGEGSAYGSGTVAHPLFSATSDATTLTISHRVAGTAGNGIANLTDVGAWGGNTAGGTDGSFTVGADGDLVAGELVKTRGLAAPANNGLFVVGTGSSGTQIIPTSPLTAEVAAPAPAILEIAGVQGASGDLTIDSSGDLNSTILDFTDFGLTEGQFIKIGGTPTATKFGTAADNAFVRVTAIAATKLTLDRRNAVFVADAGVGKTIQVFYGRFLRNVDVSDPEFLVRSYTMEVAYDSLAPGPAAHYEYAEGNRCNEWTLTLPLANKATCSYGFVGTDTDPPSTSRLTGADAATDPVKIEMLNTSSEIARLRLMLTDETGISTDFESLTLTIANGVTPMKKLGTLGAFALATGNFLIDVDAGLYFTDARVPAAIRNNTSVAMDLILKNSDGAMVLDIPEGKLGGGGKSFPVNEFIRLQTTLMAHKDPTLGYSMGLSLFPHVPA